MDALIAAKQYSDALSPFINQYALAAFIADGHLARHIRKMRSIYNQRRRLILDSLPGWLHPIPSFAGLHIAALVKNSKNAEDLVERARDVGVGIGTVGRYSVGKLDLQGLVFGYGAIAERSITEGLKRLRQL
jgi:GntR family transcriptional regulator/MocR family aminotransferase